MNKNVSDDFDESQLFAANQSSVFTNVIPEKVAAASPKALMAYYRTPGLHVTLPTGGAFLPPGSLQTTMGEDIPVLPMRAADEILLKSPDALMSGYAIEQLIRSCVPSIQTPRLISTPDLDVLLLAIRAATYGDTMSIDAACPKCGHLNNFQCHLPTLLSTMKCVDPVNIVRLSDDVVAYIRPYNLSNATKVALVSFEETRKMQAIQEGTAEDQKNQMNKSMSRLSKMNVEMMADCIVKVVIPSGEVTNRAEISEFLDNISRVWVKKIEDMLKTINTKGVDKKIHVTCDGMLAQEDETEVACGYSWDTEVEFDPANFFDGESST